VVAAASQDRLHRGFSMTPDARRLQRLPLAQSWRWVRAPMVVPHIVRRQLALAPRLGKAPCQPVVPQAPRPSPALLGREVPAAAPLRVAMRLL
jgi:hypothetical protein